MTSAAIVLRPWAPDDGAAIQALGGQSPDTGAVAFVGQFEHDAYAVLTALHPACTGVVAEAADHPGIVGMGLVTFGRCQYEGEERPFAYLSSLQVHPGYRRRGVASALAAWRVNLARERFAAAGEAGVVFAGIQSGNTGSIRTAESWSTQRLDGHSRLAVLKVRSSPPGGEAGLRVRPALPEELEGVAAGQNEFHADYNLYPRETAESLRDWSEQRFLGQSIHAYHVAVDRSDNVLAGIGVTFDGSLITSRVLRMPLALRLANRLLRVVPADGTLKRLKADRFWFLPGEHGAARFLLESIRWQLRERGTTVMLFFDPMSSVRRAIPLPRIVPGSTGSVVLAAPAPASPTRPLYLNP
jgi:GNAT superfamily N-acetyltransferase